MDETTKTILEPKETVITDLTNIVKDAAKHPFRTALILGAVSKAIARIVKASKK